MVAIFTGGDVLLETHIFEKAFPQERPRINRHTRSIYSPVEKQGPVRRQLDLYDSEPIAESFFLTAHFFYKDLKDFKKNDVDNLIKALADSLQAVGVITNDNLMVGCHGTKNMCGEDWIWLELRKAKQLSISLEAISRTVF